MSEMKIEKPKVNQLDSLVLLRGIAVIMVCFCHFGDALSSGNHSFTTLFSYFHIYGKFGVQIFFVISGFIIPYSLSKGKYQFIDYPSFLYKRLLRLHPPYLLALATTLIVMYFSYKARHVAYPENFMTIFNSLFYFHTPSDNPVFWTLAVEAQYYIFIGLFYILLINYTEVAYFVVIPIFLFLGHSQLANYFTLLNFFVFFFIGNALFMTYLDIGNKIINIISLLLLIVYSYFFYEIPAFIFSLFTVIFILLYTRKVSSYLKFVGTISYSVYLIHFPFGIKLINLIRPKLNPSYSGLLFIATTILSLLISYFFYKVIEEFSERVSKNIKYKAFYLKN